jgi:hypothetical protein
LCSKANLPSVFSIKKCPFCIFLKRCPFFSIHWHCCTPLTL